MYFQKQFDDRLTPAVSQGFSVRQMRGDHGTLDLAGQMQAFPCIAFSAAGCVTKSSSRMRFLSTLPPRWLNRESYPFVKCFKLKVSGDEKTDAARVRAVIEARPDADIWLDANQSYRPSTWRRFSKASRACSRCAVSSNRCRAWIGLGEARA